MMGSQAQRDGGEPDENDPDAEPPGYVRVARRCNAALTRLDEASLTLVLSRTGRQPIHLLRDE